MALQDKVGFDLKVKYSWYLGPCGRRGFGVAAQQANVTTSPAWGRTRASECERRGWPAAASPGSRKGAGRRNRPLTGVRKGAGRDFGLPLRFQ